MIANAPGSVAFFLFDLSYVVNLGTFKNKKRRRYQTCICTYYILQIDDYIINPIDTLKELNDGI